MKKVLFYGRVFKKDEKKVHRFLDELIRTLLTSDFQIITREGTSDPEKYDAIWLDNMVLEIACSYRDKLKLPHESVMSFIMNDDDHVATYKRKKRYLSSTNRLSGYQEMLSECDVIIGIGGTEGVYRLGLFAAGTKKLFIPLAIGNGTAKKLAKEFKHYLDDNYTKDLYPLISLNELTVLEVSKLVTVIAKCIDETSLKSHSVSEEDFFRYIDEHPERIKNFPAHYFWKLMMKLPIYYFLLAIAFIITIITLLVNNIRSSYFSPSQSQPNEQNTVIQNTSQEENSE